MNDQTTLAPTEETEPPFDHSVPYPDAPEPDYDDETQEHYRGVKDPEIVAAHRARKGL